MEFFKVKSFAEAENIIRTELNSIKQEVETVSVRDACGRRAARDVFSKVNLPEYNRSTVDGYAVKAVNTYGASESVPSMLKVLGKVTMGKVGEYKLTAGETVFVPTGGAIPDGADAMVMLEYTGTFGDEVAIYKPAAVRDNIMCIGEDVAVGAQILRRGQTIQPLKIGVFAALGEAEIEVFKPLKIAVISTGDELVDVDAKTQIGQIIDVNTLINIELCKNNGFQVVLADRVKDGFELLNDAVERALSVADIVLVSGGSSIGARDFTEQVFSTCGDILAHGIALKPGKPTLIAKSCDGKLMFGLPGHPMACLLVLKLLVINSINTALGEGAEAPFVYAATTTNFPSSPGRLTVQPVSIEYGVNGIAASPLFYKSGFVGVLDKADGYILIPENAEGVTKGESVKVFLL